MTEKITSYIKEQTCATICCVDEQGMPYCFNCFYAYNEKEQLLYYKSSGDTTHSGILLKNPVIAGSILPDKLVKIHIRGLQFEGILLGADNPVTKNGAAFYYKQHPLAVAMPGDLWTLQLNHLKLTDNALGFGKKIEWRRTGQPEAV